MFAIVFTAVRFISVTTLAYIFVYVKVRTVSSDVLKVHYTLNTRGISEATMNTLFAHR